MRIGIDDGCPCDSGRKYKDCCINKIKKRKFPPRGELKTYPEKFAVNGLLKSVEEFKNFYNNERDNISGEVFWTEYTQLEQGTSGMAIPLKEDGNNLVLLPIMPPQIEHAFTVAHELGHLLRKSAENNFSIGGSGHASFINSMIEDHLVDSILAKYGFNLKAEYELYLRKQIPIVESCDFFPDEINALTHFTNLKLRCDLVGAPFSAWNELEALLESKFPDLADGVNRLYQFIKGNESDIHTSKRKEQLKRIVLATAARHPANSPRS